MPELGPSRVQDCIGEDPFGFVLLFWRQGDDLVVPFGEERMAVIRHWRSSMRTGGSCNVADACFKLTVRMAMSKSPCAGPIRGVES